MTNTVHSEFQELLRHVESEGVNEYLQRDEEGNVVSITLHRDLANDNSIAILRRCSSIRELRIQGPSQGGKLTREGIARLSELPNLATLRVCCTGMLKSGVFEEMCKLRRVRQLEMVAAFPPKGEYYKLTNMQNLAVLTLTHCTNFGNKEVHVLTNLMRLTSLTATWNAFDEKGAIILRNIGNLTNLVIRIKK